MPDATFFARARAAAERLMVDECTITRDPGFADDSTLNTTTGLLAPPSPATVTIYAGKCTVTPGARQENEADEGGAPIVRSHYQATIPVDEPEVAIGDVLTVTSSVRDTLIVGRSFVVRSAPVSTNAFHRRLLVESAVRADVQ